MITICNETYYTSKELAEKFQVTQKCINDWKNKGWLKYKKIGNKKILFSETDIKQFLERN